MIHIRDDRKLGLKANYKIKPFSVYNTLLNPLEMKSMYRTINRETYSIEVGVACLVSDD